MNPADGHRPRRTFPGSGTQHAGFEHARSVAKSARDHPGVWVDLRTGASRDTAHNKVYILRHKPSVAFRPVGSFEARSERRGDTYAVLVRYVGEPS